MVGDGINCTDVDEVTERFSRVNRPFRADFHLRHKHEKGVGGVGGKESYVVEWSLRRSRAACFWVGGGGGAKDECVSQIGVGGGGLEGGMLDNFDFNSTKWREMHL